MHAAGPRILLVDDDTDIRESLGEILLEEGYDVRQAGNGRDALDELARDPIVPSVIVLDLMMPVMNGWQFRSEQRRDPRLAHVPVVVITASGDLPRVARELSPACAYEKPIDLGRLLSSLRALVA